MTEKEMTALIKSKIKYILAIGYNKGFDNSLERDEIIQAGMIGLYKAIIRFDFKIGCDITKLASMYIFKELQVAACEKKMFGSNPDSQWQIRVLQKEIDKHNDLELALKSVCCRSGEFGRGLRHDSLKALYLTELQSIEGIEDIIKDENAFTERMSDGEYLRTIISLWNELPNIIKEYCKKEIFKRRKSKAEEDAFTLFRTTPEFKMLKEKFNDQMLY